MHKPFGLAQRIFLGFALQLLLIVGIYSVAMMQSTEFMENVLVSEMLREELEMSVQELNSHEELQLPPSMKYSAMTLGLILSRLTWPVCRRGSPIF